MRLVMLGPPGAGKGTQAVVLAGKLGVPHISTGDMFRAAMKQGTPMGLQAKAFIDKGELVPDEVTIGLVRERLGQEDARKGFVLDGFPRTIVQAEQLDEMLQEMGTPLEAVVEVQVSDEEIVKRLENRRSCPTCGRVYHLLYNKPQVDQLCDEDSTPLIQRSDDTRDVILNRITVYNEKTGPLAAYYAGKGNLVPVNGGQDIKGVLAEIGQRLNVPALTR